MVYEVDLAAIAEVQEGNHNAYEIIVEKYYRGLVQHIFNYVNDGPTAEDIAQDAFIQAFYKLNQYKPEYAFSTWLYKIADNLAYKYFKKLKNTTDIDEIAHKLEDDRPLPPDLLEKKLSNEKVKKAVDILPHNYKRVILLYYWQNLSYEEIAIITNKPIGTIRTWLSRAKLMLSKELYEQF